MKTQKNLIDASTTDETARSDNLDSILQPALRNMVSSSLYRVSEEDTKNARIACSLRLGFIIFLTKRHRMV